MLNHLHDANLKNDLRQRLFELIMEYAVERKSVTLASKQQSQIYFDCRQIYLRGEAQYIIGELFYSLLTELESNGSSFAASGGMAMGSIPLSCALSAAAFRRGRAFSGAVVRKEAKSHGMQSLIEGDKCLVSGGRIAVLEDVVTTASSAIKAITKFREVGLTVDHLFALIDRRQGGEKNLQDIGVKLHAIFVMDDFLKG